MFKRFGHNFNRRLAEKPLTKGKALIEAREILGPNVLLSENKEEGDYEIFLHTAWKGHRVFTQRFHARGFDKRLDFIEVMEHTDEVIEEGFVLVACGSTWKEALAMARSYMADKQQQQQNQKEEEKMKNDQA